VLIRGGDPPAGRHEVSGEADAVGVKHEPVLSPEEPRRRGRLPGATTAAGGVLWLYSRAAARGRRLARRWQWLPGWTFAAVTQLPVLLAVAWLVPGTGMLLAGRLLPVPMVIMFVPLVIALCYFAMRRLPVSWPRVRAPDAAGAPRRADVPAAAVVAMVAIAAGFGVWQAYFRSEQVFVASDPGVYLHYGYWIAGHGTPRIPVSAPQFGAVPGLDFATTGFTVSGSSITPSFLPGLPLVLAGGTWLGGLGGALLMPAVLGGCAVLSFAGLAGRLCGAWWAVAGELVLALSLPQVYASRAPFSEPLVQVLLFGGLCLFIDSLAVRSGDVARLGTRIGITGGAGGGLALAGLAGLALGLTVLASIASLGVLLPAFPVLAVLFVTRRPQAGPFGGGLFVGIGLGLSVGLVLARPYLAAVSPPLHLIGLCAAGFGLVTALVAPLSFPGARSRLRRVLARQPHFESVRGERVVLPSLGAVVSGLALVLPVLVLAAFAVRPYFQTVRENSDPSLIRTIASLQRLERLPVDGLRQYYESSLSWVLWYVGVPVVLLACAGAAILGRELVRSVLVERPFSADALRLWVLPFLIIAWVVCTVLWEPSVVPWQPLGSHRLVPVVLPGILLLGVWMSSWLTARTSALGASRAIVVLVAACCVLALAIPPLVTTLNPGLAAKPSVGRSSSGVAKFVSRVRLRGVGASATYAGSLSAATSLCAAIGQSATVLFTDPATAAAFAPAVRGLCGQPAALVVLPRTAAAASLSQAVTSIEEIGQRPVLLGPSRSSVSAAGVVPHPVISLRTSGDAQVLTGPPAGTWPVTYTVWLAAPPGTGTGTGQLSGAPTP
jgi:hypothetical protein